jgi:hypothetical protein
MELYRFVIKNKEKIKDSSSIIDTIVSHIIISDEKNTKLINNFAKGFITNNNWKTNKERKKINPIEISKIMKEKSPYLHQLLLINAIEFGDWKTASRVYNPDVYVRDDRIYMYDRDDFWYKGLPDNHLDFLKKFVSESKYKFIHKDLETLILILNNFQKLKDKNKSEKIKNLKNIFNYVLKHTSIEEHPKIRAFLMTNRKKYKFNWNIIDSVAFLIKKGIINLKVIDYVMTYGVYIEKDNLKLYKQLLQEQQ